MSRIIWDKTGEKYFETGTRNGVLYVQDNTGAYGDGVPWNGLTGFTESPTGAESNKMYADDILYADLRSAEELEGSLTAYTYPDEFAECDGSAEIADGVYIGQQVRKKFGFCYRSTIGNDVNMDVGYKLHIIYGATASPSEKAYATINDSPEGIEFSWDITTTPVNVASIDGKTFKPTASIIIDSRKYPDVGGAKNPKLKAIEDALYGVDADSTVSPAIEASAPRLLLPDEIVQILSA